MPGVGESSRGQQVLAWNSEVPARRDPKPNYETSFPVAEGFTLVRDRLTPRESCLFA